MNKQERAERLNEMLRLYEKENLSLEEIGALFGVSRQAVSDRFKRAGIRLKRRKAARIRRHLDREILVRLYRDENLKVADIAKLLRASSRKVSRELKRHKIQLRPKNFSQRKHPQLWHIKVGEIIEIKRPEVKNPYRNLHAKAFNIGIRISVKNVRNDIFQVKRLR